MLKKLFSKKKKAHELNNYRRSHNIRYEDVCM
jgi:hypothetical protein